MDIETMDSDAEVWELARTITNTIVADLGLQGATAPACEAVIEMLTGAMEDALPSSLADAYKGADVTLGIMARLLLSSIKADMLVNGRTSKIMNGMTPLLVLCIAMHDHCMEVTS